jgi:hypothetical protein
LIHPNIGHPTACITFYNYSGVALTLSSFTNQSRCPNTLQSPQQRLASGATDSFATSTWCPFTGTFGTVTYTLSGGGQLTITWGNPYSDENWYHTQVPAGYTLTQVGGHDVDNSPTATPVFTLIAAPGTAAATTQYFVLSTGERLLAPVPGPPPPDRTPIVPTIVSSANPPASSGGGQPACDGPQDSLTVAGGVTGTGGNCGSFTLTLTATGPADTVTGSTPRVFVPVINLSTGATSVGSFVCPQTVPPTRTVTCTVTSTVAGEVPIQGATVTVRFQTIAGTADVTGSLNGPGGVLRTAAQSPLLLLPLVPPPPPIVLPPLPPPVVPIAGPSRMPAAPEPATFAEVPLIPEADSLSLLVAGLLLSTRPHK